MFRSGQCCWVAWAPLAGPPSADANHFNGEVALLRHMLLPLNAPISATAAPIARRAQGLPENGTSLVVISAKHARLTITNGTASMIVLQWRRSATCPSLSPNTCPRSHAGACDGLRVSHSGHSLNSSSQKGRPQSQRLASAGLIVPHHMHVCGSVPVIWSSSLIPYNLTVKAVSEALAEDDSPEVIRTEVLVYLQLSNRGRDTRSVSRFVLTIKTATHSYEAASAHIPRQLMVSEQIVVPESFYSSVRHEAVRPSEESLARIASEDPLASGSMMQGWLRFEMGSVEGGFPDNAEFVLKATDTLGDEHVFHRAPQPWKWLKG